MASHLFWLAVAWLPCAWAAAASAPSTALATGAYYSGSCDPFGWHDFTLDITQALVNSNLVFEVEDLNAVFNPTSLLVVLWGDGTGTVPANRQSEHRSEFASGKIFSVGMNNERFKVGTATLGVRCNAGSVSYRARVLVVEASLTLNTASAGEVCASEWVYHYYTAHSGHHGTGKHVRFTVAKSSGEATAVTHHLTAPLKKVPPYTRLEESTTSATLDLCNVEVGKQYLGFLGGETGAACAIYTVTPTEVTGTCAELAYTSDPDPASVAHATIGLSRFERASCSAGGWYDYYCNVTDAMVTVEDNLLFEVEVLDGGGDPDALSIHLFHGSIPLDRVTEHVATVPDGALYSIALPSTDIAVGAYYLSIRCGTAAQRFRALVLEVRGQLQSTSDEVSGEVCPAEWIYHSIKPGDSSSHGRRLDDESGEGGPDGAWQWHRQLGSSGSSGGSTAWTGKNVKLTLTKYSGDLHFMTMVGDHAPKRLQAPYRQMGYAAASDYAIFCNLQPGNQYYLALVGGEHCAAYKVSVSELETTDHSCDSGTYDLVSNVVSTSGLAPLVLESTAWGSASSGAYADYSLPLTFAHDADANLLFELENRDAASRSSPFILSLHVYAGGEIPADRQTEVFADVAKDGIVSVMVNMLELRYQLCSATGFQDSVCAGLAGHGSSSGSGHRRLASLDAHGHSVEWESDPTEGTLSRNRRRGLGSAASAGAASSADLTYLVSVKCNSQGAPCRFKLLATEISAGLTSGKTYHGELCPGAFVYHHWSHAHVGQTRDVRFSFTKHSGDAAIMVRHGTTMGEMPLKLNPPYKSLGAATLHDHVDFCGASGSDAAHPHEIFVVIVGGTHCMSYEIVASEITAGCTPLIEHNASAPSAITVDPHHFVYSSCRPGEYVDFSLTLQTSDSHYNYLIEVEDLAVATGHDSPQALSVHLYERSIPDDRHTEYRAERAIDGIYSVAINEHNFHAGERYFAVKGESSAAGLRRFRVVVYQVESLLTVGKQFHGEVCPGDWVYHSYTVPAGSAHNFQFHVTKHMGDLDVIERHAILPIKLLPPYVHMGTADHATDVHVCNAPTGETVYLGMLGGHQCASYEVELSVIPDGAPCAEPPHSQSSYGTRTLHELTERHWGLGSCAAAGWSFWYVDISVENQRNNLMFELVDLDEASGAVDAVTVFMYPDAIPDSLYSEYRVARSQGGVYALAFNAHEFEPQLLWHEHTRRFYFGVECGAAHAVRFKAIALFVHSNVELDSAAHHHVIHGEVCPSQWVHHHVTVDSRFDLAAALSAASSTAAVAQHRRVLASGGLTPHGSHANGSTGVPAEEGQQERRKLASSSGGANASAAEAPGVHLRISVTKNIGELHYLMSYRDAPLSLVPPYRSMGASGEYSEMVVCDVHKLYHAGAAAHSKYYISFFGGSACASYEFTASIFTASCAAVTAAADTLSRSAPSAHRRLASAPASTPSSSPPSSPPATPAPALQCLQGSASCALSLHQYVRASCEPHERSSPFVLALPYGPAHVWHNLVFVVLDKNAADNPSSLSVALYAGTGSHEELAATEPLVTTTAARLRIFSVALHAIELGETICGGTCNESGTGYLSLVVQCASTAVAYSVLASSAAMELPIDEPRHGEVCPGSWIFHSVGNVSAVRFEVIIHQGDTYYMTSRWHQAPSFAACNGNELRMTGRTSGAVELCDASRGATPGAPSTALVGLYGGRACALYTITARTIASASCTTATKGICNNGAS